MDKSPDAFRTISEVADALETPAHVLRFWETRFPQIKPVKRAGGRRYYRPSDVALLTGIKRLLHDDGLTIRGVQKILREQGIRHVAGLGGAIEVPRSRLDDPLDIMDETGVEDRAEGADVLPFPRAASSGDAPDLWPDAGLTPAEDETVFVTEADDLASAHRDEGLALDAEEARLRALLSGMETPAPDAGVAATADDRATVSDAAPPATVAEDDILVASVLNKARAPAPAPHRAGGDGWQSLPLAAGEDMPLAARLRALPKGALAPRRTEIGAWMIRARDLARSMAVPADIGPG